MTADPCASTSTLVRGGLTQSGRVLAELSRDHFRPDERDLADLILFGQRFAAHIAYYDHTNVAAGDWRVFFESDMTAALAALSKLPVAEISTFQGDVARWLSADPARNPAALGAHFRLWFHLAVVPLEQIGRHLSRLPSEHSLSLAVPRLIARDLYPSLGSVAGWYKGAIADAAVSDPDLFSDTPVDAADLNVDGIINPIAPRLTATVSSVTLNRPVFGQLALPDPLFGASPLPSWAALYASATLDGAPFADATTPFEQIYDGLNYNLLGRAVERLMQGYLRIRADAATALTESLNTFAAHPAHTGLWLTFLDLFHHAQDQMNGFTGRHLDYYFRDVLRLKPRAATPDHAHLTFALANGTTAHLLTKGTGFRAGKDTFGLPVTFELADDIVVNRAEVTRLMAMRLEETVVGLMRRVRPRAAPVIASIDGLGEEPLPKDRPTFAPFGPAESPDARIGFAVADRRLFLREGGRSIFIKVATSQTVSPDLKPKLVVRLSGAEGWFTASDVTFDVGNAAEMDARDDADPTHAGFLADNKKRDKGAAKGKSIAAKNGAAKDIAHQMVAENTAGRLAEERNKARGQGKEIERATGTALFIVIELSPSDPPVVPVDPALHGDAHDPGMPVAEVILDFTDPETQMAYPILRNLAVSRPTIATQAGGLKMLTIIASGAEADPTKPFSPFGPRPKANDSWIIGSSEIFSKPIRSLSFDVRWQTAHTAGDFFKVQTTATIGARASVLSNGSWVPAGPPGGNGRLSPALLFAAGTPTAITLGGVDLIDGQAPMAIENPPLEAQTLAGFMRLSLIEDFGHVAFPTEQARAMMTSARGVVTKKDAKYNYEGSASSPAVGDLPLAPYDPVITEIQARYRSERGPVESFRHLHPFGSAKATGLKLIPDPPFAAAIFVGFSGFEGPARLTLLAQVEDGSGDPLLPVPDLSFAYLDGDTFVTLEARDIDDKSRNLTTSGVIGLTLPRAAGTDHDILPDGLGWIRISVNANPAALNRLQAIIAQAARVTFADAGNDPLRLIMPLPAGAISKPIVPDVQLKSVAQPFSGFGGRPEETPAAMDTRVSERLRHKNRAITRWDFEAMILGAFPALNRVKCLGLTQLIRDAAGLVRADNEALPGAVTIVAVPTIAATASRDPLRPYVDQATLMAVDRFLRPRLSPFVRLEVVNPRLEEVTFDFKVRFRPEIADTAFYRDRLNDALVAFLTPWAVSGGQDVSFGGRLWKSTIVDFLDEVPEVDFVTDVKMFHKPDVALAQGAWTPIDSDVIETTSARSILVSTARHTIRELPTGGMP